MYDETNTDKTEQTKQQFFSLILVTGKPIRYSEDQTIAKLSIK